MTKKYFAKAPWELQNSLETNINEIIVDQRWEGKFMSNTNMDVITKIIFIYFALQMGSLLYRKQFNNKSYY
jgi:hypothetical protein